MNLPPPIYMLKLDVAVAKEGAECLDCGAHIPQFGEMFVRVPWRETGARVGYSLCRPCGERSYAGLRAWVATVYTEGPVAD